MRARLALFGALVLLGAIAVTPGTSAVVTPHRQITTKSPCGIANNVQRYSHVAWILLENVGYSVVGSPDAPYLNSLGAACGLATNDDAISHPSLPNYIALTSGSTQGVTDDGEPSTHPVKTASIFSELRGNWRALVESMPQSCDRVTSGSYAARHNPAVYYPGLGTYCQRNDVPMTSPLDLSAAFTFITPNICDDMHSCPVSTGDAWLARVVPAIIKSAQYQSRSLVLVITFDENDSSSTNRVPTYVIAPSVPRGLRVNKPLSHYSLLAMTESLLHVPLLGLARHAPSMTDAFHL